MVSTPEGKRLLTSRENGTFLAWEVSKFEVIRD